MLSVYHCEPFTIFDLTSIIYVGFFLCVESGRTHKDIRLELAPLSARGQKYFFKNNSYPHFFVSSVVYVDF